jgi:hypothetical protein
MRGIITAGVRILTIYLFINILVILGNDFFIIWNTRNLPGETNSMNISIFVSVCLVIIFILWVIWVKASSLSRFLAGDIDDNNIVIQSTSVDIMKVAMRILGFCLIATTLPTLLGLAAYHIRIINGDWRMPISESTQAAEIKSWVIATVTILIGIWLVLGFRGTIIAASKIWNIAHMTNEDEDTPPSDTQDQNTDIVEKEPLQNNKTDDTLPN